MSGPAVDGRAVRGARGPSRARYDAVVVGGGHNGLTAAAYLARAGRSVLVLERLPHVGGAAVSEEAFPGARLSRYSYLVSLLPRQVREELGLRVELRRRRFASATPVQRGGAPATLLVDTADPAATRRSFEAVTGSARDHDAWTAFGARVGRLAERLWPTVLEPLRAADDVRRLVDDDALWAALVERPLGEVVDATFADDDVRGVVLTDGLIGTFAAAHEPSLRQNRCFLYHVVGGGTGDWDVPVGGMGAVSGALRDAALAAGAEVVTRAEVTAVHLDGGDAEVVLAVDGATRRVGAGHVVAGCAPAVLARLLGQEPDGRPSAAEGSQLKVNMLLARLPRLRDGVDPAAAFAGTLHVHESASELQRAHEQAAGGAVPDVPPCEVYCHSLTDPSILSSELRAAGAQTLTLFGLHMPARLFRADPDGARAAALAATLRSLDSVLAEPLEEVLLRDPDGRPCLEVRTPLDLEEELALPAGHIFHRDLAWPWAEDAEDVGRWGVETAHPRLVLAGAGARRGGGVSAIPGRAAAMALLDPRPGP